MPKSKEYVSTSSGSDSDGEQPVKKKTKAEKKKPEKKPEKKSKASSSAKPQAASGDEEEGIVELGKMRQVTASTFKGRVLVNIREFYLDNDGEKKPGRKGISLSVEQWETLKSNVDKIDRMVEEAT